MRRRQGNSRKPLWIALVALMLLFSGGGYVYYVSHIDEWLEERYLRAEELLAEGNYEDALEKYESIYDNHPEYFRSPAALFKAGEIEALYLKEYQKALLSFLLLEKNYSNAEETLRAQEYLAELYKNRFEDYGRAIVALQKLLEGGGAEGDRIQYEIADCYFHQNNYEQARIEFLSLGKNFPQSPLMPEVRYRIAVTYSLQGMSKEAENAFRNMIKEWPQSPYAVEARFALASVLEERDELLAALRMLEELQGIYPNDEALLKKLEQVRERIDKKKRAI